MGFLTKGEMGMRQLGFFQFLLHTPSTYNFINESLNTLSKELEIKTDFLNGEDYAVQMFMNLTSNDYSSSPHADNWSVIYLQLLGDVRYIIRNKNEKIIQDEIINPGDVVLIPKGSIHEILPLTPRVSLSFGMNYNQEETFSEYIEG